MTISNNYPTIRPTLLLDFANGKALDPRITFSRPTTATYYDADTSAIAEQNLLLQSQTFENGAWSFAGISVTPNTTIAPDGTTTADTLTGTLTTNSILFPTAGNSLTGVCSNSVFIKAGTADFGVLSIWSGSSTNGANIWFNAQTGALTGSSSVSSGYTITSSSSTSFGSGWFRITISATIPTALVYWAIRIVDTDNAFVFTNTVGKTLLIWGAQTEQRSLPTAYTPTTTAPVTNYIPVLLSAASNVPRFDHNPTTRESLGLLIEEQRTNLVTYSAEFDNAAWSKADLTVSANTIIAPDGTLAGETVTAGTVNQAKYLRQNSTLSAGSYTYSYYVKSSNSQRYFSLTLYDTVYKGCVFDMQAVSITLSQSATGTITNVGNGWYRCSVTATVTAGTVYYDLNFSNSSTAVAPPYVGNGIDFLFLWGAQLEAGSFATSYIPTVASQVIRSADAASMTGTNFSSWYNNAEGTVYCEATPTKISAFSSHIWTLSSSNTNFMTCFAANARSLFNNVDNINVVDLSPGTAVSVFSAGVKSKAASAYKTNDCASAVTGSSVATDTVNQIPFVNKLGIGQSPQADNFYCGTISKLAYYPLRVSNTALQSLTGS
jgi:hypothetical protein